MTLVGGTLASLASRLTVFFLKVDFLFTACPHENKKGARRRQLLRFRPGRGAGIAPARFGPEQFALWVSWYGLL